MRNRIVFDRIFSEEARRSLKNLLDQVPLEVFVFGNERRVFPHLEVERVKGSWTEYVLTPRITAELSFKNNGGDYIPEEITFYEDVRYLVTFGVKRTPQGINYKFYVAKGKKV